MREPALSYPLYELDLLFAECDLLVVVLIVDGPPLGAQIVLREQSSQPVLLGPLQQLLPSFRVPNVVLLFVPLQWHLPNCNSREIWCTSQNSHIWQLCGLAAAQILSPVFLGSLSSSEESLAASVSLAAPGSAVAPPASMGLQTNS